MSWWLAFLCGVIAGVGIYGVLLNRRRLKKGKILAGRFRRRKGDSFYKAVNHRLSLGPHFVALGGGTGLSTLLRGLKGYSRNITAVVTVTDEGGSSGRLRQEWGVLPPGDVRNCLVALAENDSVLNNILSFRFDHGELKGHSLGNLILLAATELAGDFRLAVEEMNHLLAIRGRVLPVTTEAVVLAGRTRDGKIVRGELAVSLNGSQLMEIWLEPRDAHPLPEVISAIYGADLVILGPGSLFTSVIPNILLDEVSTAIRKTNAPKVYVANLMTQPNETDGMNLYDHTSWIAKVLEAFPDYVIANKAPIPEDTFSMYVASGSYPLMLDDDQRRALNEAGCEIIEAPLVKKLDNGMLRHDSHRLAEILVRLAKEDRDQ